MNNEYKAFSIFNNNDLKVPKVIMRTIVGYKIFMKGARDRKSRPRIISQSEEKYKK
jgi:hypothetical protein